MPTMQSALSHTIPLKMSHHAAAAGVQTRRLLSVNTPLHSHFSISSYVPLKPSSPTPSSLFHTNHHHHTQTPSLTLTINPTRTCTLSSLHRTIQTTNTTDLSSNYRSLRTSTKYSQYYGGRRSSYDEDDYRSNAARGGGGGRGGGGNRQLVLLILQYTARILPRIWRSPAVQSIRQRYPKAFYSILLIPTSAIGYIVATGIERVPYTERLHLALLGPQEELQLGVESYKEVMSKEADRVLEATDESVRLTTEVARNIIDVIRADGNDKVVLPSGKIFVYTGLFPIVKNTAGLAIVLSHETGHAVARHAVEKMGVAAFSLVLTELTMGVAESSSGSNSLMSTAALLAARAIGTVGIPLAHSRKLETEADQIGVNIAARAGYDPMEGPKLWQRMAESEKEKGVGAKVPEILSTHPSHETRIENLTQWSTEARKLYEQAIAERGKRGLPIPNSKQAIHHQSHLPSSVLDRMDQLNSTALTSFTAASLVPPSHSQYVRIKL